jgi:hypothetical protein
LVRDEVAQRRDGLVPAVIAEVVEVDLRRIDALGRERLAVVADTPPTR